MPPKQDGIFIWIETVLRTERGELARPQTGYSELIRIP
jgi:hypothetical protein